MRPEGFVVSSLAQVVFHQMKTNPVSFQLARAPFAAAVLCLIIGAAATPAGFGGASTRPTKQQAISPFPLVPATQIDLTGPAGSGMFGNRVTVLPNGNFVVVDPGFDAPGPVADVGAAYLYDGNTRALISTLTGGTMSDQVGNLGIVVLTNGNYLIRSQNWNNPVGPAANAGAVTWCSATTGCNGVVSASNSLVGSTASDSLGNSSTGVLPLTN